MRKVILLLTVVFTFSGCTDECKDSLADLTTNLVTDVVGTVLAGNPFAIGATILNAVPVVVDCVSNTAGSSVSKYTVDYGASQDNFTSQDINDNYNIPSIQATSQHNLNFETIFTQPGFYRLITITDFEDSVNEQDENNNTYNGVVPFNYTDGSVEGKGNPNSIIIFEVLPNPDYTPEPGTPRVIMNLL